MRSLLVAVLLAALALPVLMAQSSSPNDPWYDAAWRRVERLRQEGQTRTAKAAVDSIFVRATERGDVLVRTRAALVRASLAVVLEDETPTAEDAAQGTDGSAMQALNELKAALDGADATTRPLLHSHLAESYLVYFREHRWQIMQRTDVQGGPTSGDITTWTLRDLAAATRREHHAALDALGDADARPVSEVQYLLDGTPREPTKRETPTVPNGRPLRPTVLDLLAHRALDFYEADDLLTAFPEERYRLEEAAWFDLPEAFAAAEVRVDSSLQAEVTGLYQRLTRLHLALDGDGPDVDLALRRLAFARQHSTLPDKDARYERALRALIDRYRATPHASAASFRLAQFLTEGAQRPGVRIRSYDGADAGETPRIDRRKLAEAARVCEAAVERAPATPGATACQGLIAGLRQSRLGVAVPAFVEPDTPWLLLADYARTDAAHLRVVPVTRDWKERFERADWRRERPGLLRELYAMPPAQAVRHVLPGGQDLGGHRVELPMEGRATGHYAILLSADGRFAAPDNADGQPFTFVHVTPISGVLRGDDGRRTLVRVLDRATGQPLAGTTVRVFDQEQRRGAGTVVSTARTDARGEARVAISTEQPWRYRIEAGDGEAAATLGGAVHRYDGEQGAPQPQALVFTDRALYRPGHTIRFKAIVFTSTGRAGQVMAGQTVRVTLTAPNGVEVATETFTTSDFGSVSGTFAAPTGTLTGPMTLALAVNGQHAGAAQPRVEEYRRPTFEVTFEDYDATPRFGETVTVTGKAESYAGVPLQDAQVRYRVVRQPVFPWWWWWYGGGRQEEEIANGTTNTGPDGTFAVVFVPRADPQDAPDSGVSYRYKVLADVTEASGETQVGETAVNVGFTTLRAAVVVPRTIDLAGGTDSLALVSENLSGTKVASSGRITFDLLDAPNRALRSRLWAAPDTFALSKAEHQRRFPHDPYADEADPANWPVQRAVATVAYAGATGDKIKLPAGMPEGVYRVTLTTQDSEGRPVKAEAITTVLNSRTRTMPAPSLLLADLATPSVRVGETARLLVGASEPNTAVRVDVEVDGRIVQTEHLRLSNEKQTVDVRVTDEMADGFGFHVVAQRANRTFAPSFTVAVRRPERTLDVRLTTMRSRLLPGANETWTLAVRGHEGERLAAETALTMYDASLDAIAPHDWPRGFPWGTPWLRRGWQPMGLGVQNAAVAFRTSGAHGYDVTYDALDRFGFDSFNAWSGRYGRRMYAMPSAAMRVRGVDAAEEMAVQSAADTAVPTSPPPPPPPPAANDAAAKTGGGNAAEAEQAAARERLEGVTLRRNLQETAFFFPTLATDADGTATFTFTMPEALTRWNLFAFAHTRDLKAGHAKATTVTQKDLMVTPNLPRFVREGDRVRVTARVDNRAGQDLTGEAALLVFDAATMQPVDALVGNANNVQPLAVAKDSSRTLAWTLAVPNDAAGQGSGAYVYRVVARTDRAEDGEEGLLPVLTNRTLVTETRPLPIRAGQTKTFTLDKLLASAADPSIQTQRLTLEFTPNPAWHAVTALPYLMEFPYECTEQTFSRYYANRLGSFIAQSDPRIEEVFDTWRRTNAQALVSNLERNQELKGVLLEQTPWVLEARSETERKRRVGILMETARMNAELETALRKLEDSQMGNGAWPWFRGGRDDRYITQVIVSGLGKLRHLGVTGDATGRIDRMNQRAIQYLDRELEGDYERLLRDRADTARYEPSALTVHYLYTRSFYPDLAVQRGDAQEALAFFRRKAAASWRRYPMYTQLLLALSLHRTNHADVRERPVDGLNVAQRILRSARENARRDDELGMYWENTPGWFWWQAPIERQALTIEAFAEIAQDREAVAEMRIWLLKQKQVQDWKTTRATVDAIYALLLEDGRRGETTARQRAVELLAEVPNVVIQVGNETMDTRTNAEAGTGYVSRTWTAETARPDMGRVTVTMPQGRTPVAWGALYWQFFQPLDRVAASQPGDGMAGNPLRLRQELFVERASPSGPQLAALSAESPERLRVGDVVVQRVVLRVDRAMEYVHMKSLRASGFDIDARDQASRWQYRDGLAWYQSARDASTDFFFPWLPVGTYVFEYRVRVRHAGSFSGALTSIQSMYAPEFAAHSEGHRLTVDE